MSRYEGPVVDAHHHFWEPAVNHHPWLEPAARIPFRYGDYESIKRRYLPDEYRADLAGVPVVRTVYVETEWDPADPVGEMRYASGLAARHGWPNALVAQAWLDRGDVADVLAQQASMPLVRSVRHKPGGPANQDAVGTTRSLMSDERWRRGFALLATHGLHFDLQTPWWNLHEAVELAIDHPETTIILNHAGLPAQRDEEGLHGWARAMAAFARQPNVAVKLSGMGVPGQPWHTAEAERIVRTALDLFGAERSMFGSNFPVDRLCAPLGEIFAGFQAILSPLPEVEQAAFFHDTARRIYRPSDVEPIARGS